MHPVLADFGRFKLYSYGMMLFISFMVCIFVANKRGRKFGLPEGAVLDFSVAIIVSSLIGCRALYIFTHLEEFRGRWFDTINPIQSDGRIGIAGMVLLGGIVLAILTLMAMAWLRNINMLTILDIFAPPLALGIAIGRIGCLFNGCCFGFPTDMPWGIVFPPNCPAGSIYHGQHVHPTQIYELIYGVAIFVFLTWSEDRWGKFKGYSTSMFLILYGILRIMNESIRWYEESMKVFVWENGVITVSQVISFGTIIIGIVLLIISRNVAKKLEPDGV